MTLHQADHCRICGNSSVVTVLSDLKTRLGEIYSLVQCRECSFVSTHPLPSAQMLKKYYNQEYWQKENLQNSKYLNLLFGMRMKCFLRELNKFVPRKGRILDWGAGDGNLVRLLKANGYSATGIDLYSAASDDMEIIKASIHDSPYPTNYFDAITGFHILEHVKNPLASIESAFNLLKPGGILIAEVPNISSFQSKIFRSKWQPLEIPFHLNHFNPRSLIKLFLDNFSFEVMKLSFFSHRFSPSAFLLSIFPFFTPKLVRQKRGYYPTWLKLFYLLLQLSVYPPVLVEAIFKRGGIMRIYVRKYI